MGDSDTESSDAESEGEELSADADFARLLANVPSVLRYGTADPHGVGDGDAVRQPRRKPVRLGTREGASAEEIERRAFPRANQPPCTEPKEPPASQSPFAPCVTRLDQVIPKHTQRRIRKWRHQLKRCLAAAEKGDAEEARRRRPTDLWLAHEKNSVAATAEWDWDLRPLERGEPAVPLPVSGRWGVEPHSSVVAAAVRAVGDDFADRAILAEMITGVEDDSRCRRGTLLCAPHLGAIKLFAEACAKAHANVEKNWASGGHEALPCYPLRSCPYSIVDESEKAGRPKFRLTTDLSWPLPGMMRDEGGEIDSVNGAMDRSDWPENKLMRVTQYAEALAILAGAEQRRRTRAWSLDCEAFYRNVGRQRRELWRNAIFLPDGVQLDERCCFGDASAATKCARISNVLVHEARKVLRAFDAAHPTSNPEWMAWQRRRRELAIELGESPEEWSDLFWFGMYIDDGLGGSADDLLFDARGEAVRDADGVQRRRAEVHLALVRAVLERFGWNSAPGKEVQPCTTLTALGVRVSLGDLRMRLDGQKRERYAKLVAEVLAASRVKQKLYQKLLGRLEFASGCVALGKQYMHALWRCARAKYRYKDGSISISSAARVELEWWRAELESGDRRGVPLAQPDPMPEVGNGAAAIYADAAGAGGVMAWAVRGDELLYVEAKISEAECQQYGLGIAELELLASTWGLACLGPLLSSYVVSFTDNTVALSAMRRLSTRAEGDAMPAMLRRRTSFLLENAVVEAAERITSKNNRWADLGSRGQVGVVCVEALALGLRPRRVEITSEWRDLSWLM